MSNSEVYLTRDEIEHPYANLAVMLEHKRRRAEQMRKTMFARITSSPEVLAPKLVYSFACYDRMGVYWRSTIVKDDVDWSTKEEAIAATVEKLKEIEK